MPQSSMPPTKTSLRKIKDELEFAYEGFELLKQKREILVAEIMKDINRTRQVEKNVAEGFSRLYREYKNAAVEMGTGTLLMKSLSERRRYFARMSFTRFMGQQIPYVDLQVKKIALYSGMHGTSVSYDAVKIEGQNLLADMAQYASLCTRILLLSEELKKVQRRVNALENIMIPENEEEKKYITERLEEIEREEFFVKKLLKQRQK